ncbi:MAG: DUF4332 domain-containing protein [Anaerolineales bacterium]|nr:DUF4332 domain-containing protein [Anaerolineales bacterium]
MAIDWSEVKRILSPIKGDDDLCRRLRGSFSYPFVREAFNFTMKELISYTQCLLGGDSRGRYTDYVTRLVSILTELDHAGVVDLLDLIARTESRAKWENFCEQSGVDAQDVATVWKYLVFWFIPMEKYLSGLVRDDSATREAIKELGGAGIRTNLQLLQRGISTAGRKELANSSGLPETVILELVNLADLSRMPWASKATISNIMGAGYGSIAQLANADAEQLYADFFRYGKAIGKNLKLGNEIENIYRIAKIVPALL